jgi:hypothetical protein
MNNKKQHSFKKRKMHINHYIKLQLTVYLYKCIFNIKLFYGFLKLFHRKWLPSITKCPTPWPRAPRACSRRRVLFEAYTTVSLYCSTKKSSRPSLLAALHMIEVLQIIIVRHTCTFCIEPTGTSETRFVTGGPELIYI